MVGWGTPALKAVLMADWIAVIESRTTLAGLFILAVTRVFNGRP